MEVQKERLDRQAKTLCFFFTRTRFASSFISFLTRIGFVLFLFLLE